MTVIVTVLDLIRRKI